MSYQVIVQHSEPVIVHTVDHASWSDAQAEADVMNALSLRRRLPLTYIVRETPAATVKPVARPGWLSAIIISVTLAGSASAEVLHNGKVYKTTADRIIADRQLVCDYGKARFEALPDGRQVIIMGKVCTEVTAKR